MNREARILVCFALKEEADSFRGLAAKKDEVAILLTGIGRKNAETAVNERLRIATPKQMFTCGFAGGLDPALAVGDVVFSTDDSALQEKLSEAGAEPGRFFCATRVATTAKEKQELRRTTGADAVEMESEAIQAICRERGIPCATVRVISDKADEDLPLDFNQLARPDLSLDYGKLTLAIAKSPARIPALLRLRKNCRFAGQRLAQILETVLACG